MTLQLSEIAKRMLERGYDVPSVSQILELDQDYLESLRVGINVQHSNDDLNEAMSYLAWRAYEISLNMLENGSPPVKLNIIRIMFSSMKGMMNATSPKQMQELIAEFRSAIEVGPDNEDPEDASDVDEDEAT